MSNRTGDVMAMLMLLLWLLLLWLCSSLLSFSLAVVAAVVFVKMENFRLSKLTFKLKLLILID